MNDTIAHAFCGVSEDVGEPNRGKKGVERLAAYSLILLQVSMGSGNV